MVEALQAADAQEEDATSELEVSAELSKHQAGSRLGARRKHSRSCTGGCCDSTTGEVYGVVKMDVIRGIKHFSFLADCERAPSANTVAWGRFDDDISSTGWADLTVKTSPHHTDLDQAHAAGYLEGAISANRIYQISRVVVRNHANHPYTQEFFGEQLSFLRSKAAKVDERATDSESAYWYNVALVLAQFDGLVKGYNDHVDEKRQLSPDAMWLMNSDGDVMDIERMPKRNKNMRRAENMTAAELIELISLTGHCSAMVKWVPGDDLYVSHTTWDDYSEMLRVYKHYDFEFQHPSIRMKSMAFSGYPGFISSSDDFYALDTGLVILETTLNILNEKLYDLSDPSTQVQAWVRNLVANRVATTPKQWIEAFVRFNSGTYNDQWMIVDLNRFNSSLTRLQPDTLWVLEQIPGYHEAKDMTHLLQEKTYWASYNRPYFEEVNERSMYKHYTQKHGEMFSYLHSPRARIFARDHVHARDLEGVKRLMMQNKWQTDPFSKGCPGNQIAGRFDVYAPHCSMSRVANGATDAKIASWKLTHLNRMTVAVGGPSHYNQKPFTWNTPAFRNLLHEGQPTVWAFGWQEMRPALLPRA